MLNDFIGKNRDALEKFSAMSREAGARADWVQGGGGNTSVKLPGGLMAIKASGYCLSDIRPDRAYAVLDCAALKKFYLDNEPAQLSDVEKEGSARAKACTLEVEGMDALRPSVEAGFHSLLKSFVCHTHSVYANLVCCSRELTQLADRAFAGADYAWGWVPYTDPGARLTFAIRDELRRVERLTGREPAVLLMQNHGLIVHDDDPDRCLAISRDANERLAAQFGLAADSFPEVRVRARADGLFEADTPFLRDALRSGRYTCRQLLDEPLYPDQIVFLNGTFFMDRAGAPEAGTCVADSRTGALLFNMDGGKALVLAQTLAAVMFVMDHIAEKGLTLSTMGEAGKAFIANWESEKYRKSLAGKKG
jgi:rhamnose utilization protein RhaD (predicted bifunctional aldolase and dehydrogenase)